MVEEGRWVGSNGSEMVGRRVSNGRIVGVVASSPPIYQSMQIIDGLVKTNLVN